MPNETTANLGLPYIYTDQAQKEVTINESLTTIDAILNNGAISISETTPPITAIDGEVYIIPSGATGIWSGQQNKIAHYNSNFGWRYISPNEGVTIWVNDEDKLYTFDGTSWVESISALSGTPSGKSVVAQSMSDVVQASSTKYYAAFPGQGTDNSFENNRHCVIPTACTIADFNVQIATTQSGTGSYEFVIRKNSVDTDIAITIAAGSSAGIYTDSTNTAIFAAGDLISIKAVNSATANSAVIRSLSFSLET